MEEYGLDKIDATTFAGQTALALQAIFMEVTGVAVRVYACPPQATYIGLAMGDGICEPRVYARNEWAVTISWHSPVSCTIWHPNNNRIATLVGEVLADPSFVEKCVEVMRAHGAPW